MSEAFRPRDESDRTLVARVRPPGWRNPAPSGRYDLVVLGAGTAGLVAAAGAAGLGARVALVERGLMGGDCLVTGCVPSKALLRSARAAADARAAGRYGVRIASDPTVDFGAVMERMRRIRADLARHDSAERFRELGVDVFLGAGAFSGEDRIDVDGRTLRFRRAVVATGGRPVLPEVPGLAEAEPLTSATVFALESLPARLTIVGGGPIGCELAQAFARFGARVTLVEQAERLLPRDEPEAAAAVRAALERDGVDVRLGAGLSRVEPGPGGSRCAIGGAGWIEVDRILVAAGRAPQIAALGLERAGIELDGRGGIRVDDGLRTTNRRVYAAGDVVNGPPFTHRSDAHARIVVRNALFPGRSRASALRIPWCTFTDPEVAQVGLGARAATELGIAIDTFHQPLSGVDRSVLEGETEGFARVHVRAGRDEILGATIVARRAGEMISEITLAMESGTGLGALSRTIHPYPTEAEALRKLGDAWQRTRLTPRVRRILGIWLALRR